MPWILVGGGVAAVLVLMGIGLTAIIAFRAAPAPIVARPVAVEVAVPAPAPFGILPAPGPATPAAPVANPKQPQVGWVVAFRSNDPTIWNKDLNEGPDHRAVSIKRLPVGIRYLRIQECTNNQFVIIPISIDRLAKDSVQDGFGWNGTGRMEWNGRHLGVYNLAWDQLQRGEISFSTPAFFKGYKGWGFGHRIRDDDVQGYAWNGIAMPRTVFEVAVTTDELSTAEKEHLLDPAGMPPPAVAKVELDPVPQPAPPVEAKTPASKSPVFVFDGKSRIVTPLERFAPATLEAWFRVRPPQTQIQRSHGDRVQFLIGSDIPGQYGYGVGIRWDGRKLGGLQTETLRSFLDGRSPISIGEWHHAAAVIGPTDVAMYLDGNETFRENRNLEVLGGTNFSIGKSGPDAVVPFFFQGEIREIRISTGVRYAQSFTPPPTFQKDGTSALIYRSTETSGRTVTDLSGNGRNGQLDGVVVAGEDEKIPDNPTPPTPPSPPNPPSPTPTPSVVASGTNLYEPNSHRFTIAIPKGKKTESSSRTIAIPVPPGKMPAKGMPARPVLSVEFSTTLMSDGTRFTAASLGLPAAFLREVPEEHRLELYRDAFLKGANGQIVSETEIRQGKFAGREYLVDLPTGQLRMQLLMLGGAGCYAMVETNAIERLAMRDVDEFFDSFKIKE